MGIHLVPYDTALRRRFTAMQERLPTGNTRSMLLMVFAMGVFVLNDTITKTVSGNLETGQIISIRGAMSTALMLPLVFYVSSVGAIARSYSRPMLIRNIAE
ncbi:MAG: hypothetical protein AAFR60_05165, partial [Pseudomonadota bacterium]